MSLQLCPSKSCLHACRDTTNPSLGRGTQIILHLKEDQLEHLEERKLKVSCPCHVLHPCSSPCRPLSGTIRHTCASMPLSATQLSIPCTSTSFLCPATHPSCTPRSLLSWWERVASRSQVPLLKYIANPASSCAGEDCWQDWNLLPAG